MNLVFMGTPDIAAHSLEKLIEAGHTVSAVFTKPDKPVGRKQIMTAPPVKELAICKNIPVYQPETLRDGEAYRILKGINPEIIVVVAYGKLLPKDILDLPKHGCINAHASLLPKFRGSSPIQWSIVCGETKTGITTMYMDEGMDTGDIIETDELTIGADETAEELFERLSVMAGDLLCSTLDKIENGTATRTPQNESAATYAPMIKKEMGKIDFNNP
ncbi:MAG: methionyl-tRNA formyltransferase, partial [Clostridia bacterium]|nr:methionyl-tRNA formyltransferase [Clostridia bacterium]